MIRTKIHIPTDWSGDQAKAVIELLDDISSVIWDVHEDKILEAINKEESLLERAIRVGDHRSPDDDFPF